MGCLLQADTDEDIDEQELEAHYSYMAKIQEVPTTDSGTNTELLEQIPYDRSDPANRFVPDREETLTLEKDSRSKLNKDLLKPYDYTKQTSLYENFKPAELVDQAWEKHSHDHFRAPTAYDMKILIKTCLMPLALKTRNGSFKFVYEIKQEMHADLKYIKSLEKEIVKLESDKADFLNMYDLLLQEFKECDCLAEKLSKQIETVSKEVYNELSRSFSKLENHSICLELALQQCQEQMKNDTVCKEKASIIFQKERVHYFEMQNLKAQLQDKNIAIRVNHRTNVSIPPLRSTQMKDKVMLNNSQVKVKKTEGNDLLTCNRGSDLYTISVQETTSSTPICFVVKASPTQAWLWHQRLSHLNFDYINLLSKKDIVIGLPKLKYVKDQLCSSCEVSKAKRSSFKTKVVPSSKGRLNLLHMDLCGPMRVESINGMKYILVIVDDYSKYT
ncbi:retrovirus-related pol polyprotein from transposon TNT 1-94 [Tanacetum coccineum]